MPIISPPPVVLSSSTPQTGAINVSGEIRGADLRLNGLSGATSATRYVGGTTSGAPASGTFQAGDFVIDQSGKVWVCTAAGTPGTWAAAASGGTVTSVALSAPGEFSVSGSPITSSGTLTLTKATQSANLVYAGPTTGAALAPTFRNLVAADIPALAYVTSVALSLPSIFTVSGSPVTSSGTLTGTLATQSANLVFAGPTTGVAATPGFRALVAADIPALDASKITTGQLAQARGGTGLDTSGVTDGQLLIGQTTGNSFALATLTAGSGISVTNGGHSITVATTGYSPQVKTANYTATAADTMVVAGANTLTITLPAASAYGNKAALVVKNDNFTGTSVAAAGTDTIDGAATYSLAAAYASVRLVSDGVSVWRAV